MGMDWSSTHHDVCFMNEKGGSILEIQIPHSDEGIELLHAERCKLGMDDTEVIVGVETSYNPIVDYLVRYEFFLFSFSSRAFFRFYPLTKRVPVEQQ